MLLTFCTLEINCQIIKSFYSNKILYLKKRSFESSKKVIVYMLWGLKIL